MSNVVKPPVVVVGAGLSGLTAAFRLQCAGVPVTVLEASAALDEPDATSDFAPLAAAVPGDAPALHALACELGLRKLLRRIPLDEALGATPGVSPVWGAARLRRLHQLLRGYGEWLDPTLPERGERLDDRSVADWAKLYLGARASTHVYAPLLATHYGLDANEVSRLLAILLLDPLGRMRLSLPFGLEELRRALAARIHDVRLGQRVRRVARDGALELESGDTLAARAVVLAIPAAEVGRCAQDLNPAERSMLARLRSQPVLQVALRARVAAAPQPVCWAVGPGPLAGLVDRTALLGQTDVEERSLVLIARADVASELAGRTDEELAPVLLAAAEQLMPALSQGGSCRVWRSTVPRFRVGDYRAVLRLRREAALQKDRAWIQAGVDLVAPHAEGAVVAGTRAAEQCLTLPALRP